MEKTVLEMEIEIKNIDNELRESLERFKKECDDEVKYANEKIALSIIKVLDSLESAMKHIEKGDSIKHTTDGILLTTKEFSEKWKK